MNEVIAIKGVTPDPKGFPNAVREWCINSAAVDPITRSVLANSEDGKLYRWDLTSNTFSQVRPPERLERASAPATETATGESSSSSPTPARPARTSSRRGDEHLVHVAGHAVHRIRKEDGVEACAVDISSRRGVPTGWAGHNAGESLRPLMLHTQRHRVGKILLKSVWRHALEPVSIHAVHEFLESEHGDAGASASYGFCRHLAGKQPPHNRRDEDAADHQAY